MKYNVTNHTWFRRHERAPLLTAIRLGDIAAVRAAIEAGVPITRFRQEYANGRGHDWAMLGYVVTYAPAKQMLEIVQVLADHGASLDDADGSGNTPVWLTTTGRIHDEFWRRGASPFRMKRGVEDLLQYIMKAQRTKEARLVVHAGIIQWFIDLIPNSELDGSLLIKWSSMAAGHPKTSKNTRAAWRAVVHQALACDKPHLDPHREKLAQIAAWLDEGQPDPIVRISRSGTPLIAD